MFSENFLALRVLLASDKKHCQKQIRKTNKKAKAKLESKSEKGQKSKAAGEKQKQKSV